MSNYHFDQGSARDLVSDGRWFRDTDGRYALFRGVNFAGRSKRPPYLPVMPLLTEFGGSQDWQFASDLLPNVYSTQIRAYP